MSSPFPSATTRQAAPHTAPRPASRSEETPSLVQRLDAEGGTWDSWSDVCLPIAAAVRVGGSTPAFLGLGTSWMAIFLGTLSWSAGVAGGTYFIESRKLQGPEAVGAAGGCLLVALGLAYALGTGVLDVEAQWVEGGGHPWVRVILAFAFAAVLAYGPLGALVSAAIGVWVGHRIAQHFPGD